MELPKIEKSHFSFNNDNEVHVWIASLLTDIDYFNLLSTDEKMKASRFKNVKEQKIFITSHGILRGLLSGYVDINPYKVHISRNKYGKPLLHSEKKELRLRFNLTHSESLACYIFSWKHEVGIDVEYIDNSFDWTQVANQYFTSAELRKLNSTTTELQRNEFYRLWTRKEALLKAKGIGLIGLEQLEDNKLENYYIESFQFLDYQGAIAINNKTQKVQFFYL